VTFAPPGVLQSSTEEQEEQEEEKEEQEENISHIDQ
jgi:hypothetical protein